MKSFNEPVIDFLAAEEAAKTMSVEQWFDTYGVEILKRGLIVMGKAAGAGK